MTEDHPQVFSTGCLGLNHDNECFQFCEYPGPVSTVSTDIKYRITGLDKLLIEKVRVLIFAGPFPELLSDQLPSLLIFQVCREWQYSLQTSLEGGKHNYSMFACFIRGHQTKRDNKKKRSYDLAAILANV
jgi:hypothetical protein